MSFIEDEDTLGQILKKIINELDEIQAVFLIDRDGLLIKVEARIDSTWNIADVVAYCSVRFQTTSDEGACYGLGKLKSQLTEYEGGLVISLSIKNALVNVITSQQDRSTALITLLKVNKILHNYQETLENILSQFDILSVDNAPPEIVKNMKALLESELRD